MATKSSLSPPSRAGDAMASTLSPALPTVPHPQHPAPNGDGVHSDAGLEDGRDRLPPLSREEVLPYSRPLILPDVGLWYSWSPIPPHFRFAGPLWRKAPLVPRLVAGGRRAPAAFYLAAPG